MASTEAQKAASARFRERHREEIAATNRQEPVRSLRLAAGKRYRDAHPDYRAHRREAINEQAKDYYRRRGQFVMRMREYGLTKEQFEHLLVVQGNACAICRLAFGETKSNAPHVDHDHATGRVRALLCINCNFLIGHCFEDPDVLAAAAAYLQAQKEAV
jgi:hypothetical protein